MYYYRPLENKSQRLLPLRGHEASMTVSELDSLKSRFGCKPLDGTEDSMGVSGGLGLRKNGFKSEALLQSAGFMKKPLHPRELGR